LFQTALSEVLLPGKEARAWLRFLGAAAIIHSWTAGDVAGR
jgi:hypothetical protein